MSRGRLIVIVSCLIALLLRCLCVVLAPDYGVLNDHLWSMERSDAAIRYGVLDIYDETHRRPLLVQTPHRETGPQTVMVGVNETPFVFPPIHALLIWFQGAVWHLIDNREVTLNLSAEDAAGLGVSGPITSRLYNTIRAHAADALPGTLFDLLMGWAVALLVIRNSDTADSRIVASLAFAVTVLCPPIVLNSGLWNWSDSWITALLLWCLVFLLDDRYITAGIVYGVALLTKQQAILFGPILAYVLAAQMMRGQGGRGDGPTVLRVGRRGLVFSLASVATASGLAFPFSLADALDPNNALGAFRWVQASYVATAVEDMFPHMTLRALNVWWLRYVIDRWSHPQVGLAQLLDSRVTILGMAADTAGYVMLGLGILLSAAVCLRRWRGAKSSWLVFSYLVLFSAFLFPTRVHERYIYYAVPFLVALAFRSRVWIPALLGATVVGTFEMVAYLWIPASDDLSATALVLSTALSITSVLTFAYSIFATSREPASTDREDSHSTAG